MTKGYEVREYINGGTDWYSTLYDQPQHGRLHIEEIADADDGAFPYGVELIHIDSNRSLMYMTPLGTNDKPSWFVGA